MTAPAALDLAGEKVERGATAWLQRDPHWWAVSGNPVTDINLATLDMAYERQSVLGQRYGTITAGLAYLGIPGLDAEAHGFTGPDPQHLTSLWYILIDSLRAAQGAV